MENKEGSLNTLRLLTAQIDLMGHWRLGMFFLLLVCVLYIVFTEYNRIPLILRLLWAYCLCSALYIFEFPSLPFGDFNRNFESDAGKNFA
jgi:hypothetical protein